MPLISGTDAMQFTTVPELMYEWKEFMVSTGVYTVVYSSDGTTHGAADHIVDNTVLNTARSYFILEDPAGHQFCFQAVSTNSYRYKFSDADQFTTAPGPTTTPSAADELVVWGSGSDASPVGATFINSIATEYFYWCVDTTPYQGQYYWIIYGLLSGGLRRNMYAFYPWHPTTENPDNVGVADRPYALAYLEGSGPILFVFYRHDPIAPIWNVYPGAPTVYRMGNSTPIGGLVPTVTPVIITQGTPRVSTGALAHFRGAFSTSAAGTEKVIVTTRGACHMYDSVGYGPYLKASAFTIPGAASTVVDAIDLLDQVGGSGTDLFLQRVWDTVNTLWCYYVKSFLDPTPLSAETTPNHSGSITSHQVL